jgi:hypothetical protein
VAVPLVDELGAGVAEQPGDGVRGDACGEQRRRVAMPEVVEARQRCRDLGLRARRIE